MLYLKKEMKTTFKIQMPEVNAEPDVSLINVKAIEPASMDSCHSPTAFKRNALKTISRRNALNPSVNQTPLNLSSLVVSKGAFPSI